MDIVVPNEPDPRNPIEYMHIVLTNILVYRIRAGHSLLEALLKYISSLMSLRRHEIIVSIFRSRNVTIVKVIQFKLL